MASSLVLSLSAGLLSAGHTIVLLLSAGHTIVLLLSAVHTIVLLLSAGHTIVLLLSAVHTIVLLLSAVHTIVLLLSAVHSCNSHHNVVTVCRPHHSVVILSAGHSLLHISWLMVVLSRVFVHREAKTIVRWGVQETLNMNLEGSPLLQEEHWKVCFVQTLGGASLFH